MSTAHRRSAPARSTGVGREISGPVVAGVIVLVVALIVTVGWFALFRKPAPLPVKSTGSMGAARPGGGGASHGPVQRGGDIN